MDRSYSAVISEFMEKMRFEDFTDQALEQAKRITLHALGAAFAAMPVDQAQKVIKVSTRKGGVAEATLWGGGGVKVPAKEAAFANGTIADIMDWEDCHWTGHPSAGAVPAAMAVCEKLNLSGRDYLTALIAGYEGYLRIAMAVQPSREYTVSGRNWGLVSWQIFSASLAAGKAMGFDARRFEQLLGASFYSANVAANKHAVGLAKSDVYHYQHGWCARNGVQAADFVQLGFDNCFGALDGDNGYWHKISDRHDTDWYDRDLGTHWYICDTYMKHWPANMWVQTPLEALSELMKKRPFTLDEVEKIRVSPYIPFISGDYAQTTRGMLDAQFSTPYCLTAYILDQTPGAHWFNDEMRNNEALINASSKFEFYGPTQVPNDCFDIFKQGSFPKVEVEVLFKDGSKAVQALQYPKGHPLNNFSMEEMKDHFRLCCSGRIPEERVEGIIDAVVRLEQLGHISYLADLCI